MADWVLASNGIYVLNITPTGDAAQKINANFQAIANALASGVTLPIHESDVSGLVADLASKALASDLTSHTAATAAHGATGAIVGTTNAQTLSNKTLTSPAITTPTITGAVISNNGTWSVDGSGNASFNAEVDCGSIVDSGLFYSKGGYKIWNKAHNAWLDFAARNETGSEVVYDLGNVGGISFAGVVSGRLANLSQNLITLTAPVAKSFSVNNAVLTSNVATLTTSVNHNILVGEAVSVSVSASLYNVPSGTVTAVTANTFSYALVHANIASASISGSVQVVYTGNLISFQNNGGTQKAFMDCAGNLTAQNLSGITAVSAPLISATTYNGITQAMVTGLRTSDNVTFEFVNTSALNLEGGFLYGNNNVGTGGGTWTTDGGSIYLKGGDLNTQSYTPVAATAATATLDLTTIWNPTGDGFRFSDLNGSQVDVTITGTNGMPAVAFGSITDNQSSTPQPYIARAYGEIAVNNNAPANGDTFTIYTEAHPEGITLTISEDSISDGFGNAMLLDVTDATTIASSIVSFFNSGGSLYSDFDWSIVGSGNVVRGACKSTSPSSNLTQTWLTNNGDFSVGGINIPSLVDQGNALTTFLNSNAIYSSQFTALFDGTETVILRAIAAGAAGNNDTLSSFTSNITPSGFSGGADATVTTADLKIIDGATGVLSFPTEVATPGNTSTPAGWTAIEVNGVTSYLPYYQ